MIRTQTTKNKTNGFQPNVQPVAEQGVMSSNMPQAISRYYAAASLFPLFAGSSAHRNSRENRRSRGETTKNSTNDIWDAGMSDEHVMTLDEKVEALKRSASAWAVVKHGDVNLFCDSHVIVRVGLDESSDGWEKGVKAIQKRTGKMWDEQSAIEPTEPLERKGVYGSFRVRGYLRRFGSFSVQECYSRLFPSDATLESPGPDKPLIIRVAGVFAGVLMPTKDFGDVEREWPPIPFLEDAVVYHNCPDVEEQFP